MALPSYADVTTFTNLTLAPAQHVTDVESLYPEWLAAQLQHWSRWIDARLAKRYAVPFQEPYPETVVGWLVRIVTLELYLKLGIKGTDHHFITIEARAVEAQAAIKEAADSKEGLFELPLNADTAATGISRAAPLGYSEVSPYTWSQQQRQTAIDNGEI